MSVIIIIIKWIAFVSIPLEQDQFSFTDQNV